MYEGLFKTINLVPEGGYFIGSVMDGERVVSLFKKKGKNIQNLYLILKMKLMNLLNYFIKKIN